MIFSKKFDSFEHIEHAHIPSSPTPHLALEHIRQREHELSHVLLEGGCIGSYITQAGFNTEMENKGSGMLQEIVVTIPDKSISHRIIPGLAKIFFPFSGSIHTDDGYGQQYDIPIIVPPDTSVGEHEYWDMLADVGIYKSHSLSKDLPEGRPTFVGCDDLDGLAKLLEGKRSRWLLWKR